MLRFTLIDQTILSLAVLTLPASQSVFTLHHSSYSTKRLPSLQHAWHTYPITSLSSCKCMQLSIPLSRIMIWCSLDVLRIARCSFFCLRLPSINGCCSDTALLWSLPGRIDRLGRGGGGGGGGGGTSKNLFPSQFICSYVSTCIINRTGERRYLQCLWADIYMYSWLCQTFLPRAKIL